MPTLDHQLLLDFAQQHPVELARQLEQQPIEHIKKTVKHWSQEVLAVTLKHLPTVTARQVFNTLDMQQRVSVLETLGADKSADILMALSPQERDAVCAQLSTPLSNELQFLLSFPEQSAGALMDPDLIMLHAGMTVTEALDSLRKSEHKSRRTLSVVDDAQSLVGLVDVQDLALSEPSVSLQSIVHPCPVTANIMTSQEELVELMEQYKLREIRVLDSTDRLVGTVRYETLVDVAKEEATADLQKMVGASKDEKALSTVGFAIRKRLPWLQINLVTAFLAAAVVGLFEATIAKYTALAVLLPVVAGQSGNTGAQALAVTMRGLALREVRIKHWFVVFFKELRVGLVNGIAVAATTALGVYIWSGSVGLTLIIGISMVLSMTLACGSGALVPMMLTALKQDPAQSSSIVLTTITDIVGFFSFLGIATALSTLL